MTLHAMVAEALLLPRAWSPTTPSEPCAGALEEDLGYGLMSPSPRHCCAGFARRGPRLNSASGAPALARPVALAVLDAAGILLQSAEPLRADGDRIEAGAERSASPPRCERAGVERTLLNFLTHLLRDRYCYEGLGRRLVRHRLHRQRTPATTPGCASWRSTPCGAAAR